MNGSRNVTNTTEQNTSDIEWLSRAKDEWITYRATGGLAPNRDDGKLQQETITACATRLGVARKTLYEWDKLEGFWDAVEIRRREIFTKDRIGMVWNGVFMRAAKGDAKQAEMILSHYSNYVPPTQQVKVDTSDNISELLNIVRQRRNAIDAEVDTVPIAHKSAPIEAETVPTDTKNDPVYNPPETVQNQQGYTQPVYTPPETIVRSEIPTHIQFEPTPPANDFV